MALYVPAGRRRRRAIAIGAAALVVGLVLGAVAGRATAPTIGERITSVRDDARQTASALRVISLHDQSGTASGPAGSDGGTKLVLERTRTELVDEFDRAPWLGATARRQLLDDLAALASRSDRSTPAFGQAADQLAGRIEATFSPR